MQTGTGEERPTETGLRQSLVGAFVVPDTVYTMDPLEDTLPRTYSCPLCDWSHTTHYGIRLIQAVTVHDRVEHDIPPVDSEPPC